jgi:hypothetical protein
MEADMKNPDIVPLRLERGGAKPEQMDWLSAIDR